MACHAAMAMAMATATATVHINKILDFSQISDFAHDAYVTIIANLTEIQDLKVARGKRGSILWTPWQSLHPRYPSTHPLMLNIPREPGISIK